MKMAALAMSEDNSDLASQCMAFCQALASKGQTFSFSLNALCAFFFREVSIGKFPKMSTSPFIFTFTF